jgi:peptidoglycan/xylan/chitin deacetylase (PgdA/CDA1 family)
MTPVRRRLASLLARRSGELVRSRPRVRSRLVALTFDDGPSIWTPAILDLLAEHDSMATFFVLGCSVSGKEDVLRRIVAEGHELGNHTFTHPDPAAVSDEVLVDELRRGGDAIAQACGQRPALARPPYGGAPERFAAAVRRIGAGPTVLWSIDPADWDQVEAPPIVEHVLREMRPGAIVDLHDGVPADSSGAPSRQATVDAVEVLLPELAARGYRAVTVSQLMAAR